MDSEEMQKLRETLFHTQHLNTRDDWEQRARARFDRELGKRLGF